MLELAASSKFPILRHDMYGRTGKNDPSDLIPKTVISAA